MDVAESTEKVRLAASVADRLPSLRNLFRSSVIFKDADAAGLEPDARLEGHSMAPLLADPDTDWPHMARTSFGPGNCSIRSERYRYIHYNDGSEEFYDLSRDPHEWENLIARPETAELIQEHRAFLPGKSHPVLGSGSTGHKSFKASEEAR